MNKYIRTKDGIYETWENGETCNGFGCKFNYGTIKINKKDVILQADTIEELCDYVMMIVEGGTIPTVFKLPTMTKLRKRSIEFYYDNYKEESKRDDNWFKLAIATDKGLIYVAKMNDKGELVLI